VWTSQSTPARISRAESSKTFKSSVGTRQWQLRHSGSARVFCHALYCRTRAGLLCIFVPLPTSPKVVHSGSFHWVLSVFMYFRFMLNLRVHFAGDVNKKIFFVATSKGSHEYVRSRFTRPHPLEPELPSAIKYFLKFNLYQIESFFEAMDLHTTFEFQSSRRSSFENNFKRTINSAVTRANMNEPNTHSTTWRYHCSVTCVT